MRPRLLRFFLYVLYGIGFLLLLVVIAVFFLAQKEKPETITYGMSFNTLYAEELGLNWQESYDAILDDLQVRHLRLAAHWPMVEPKPDSYNFAELDYQIKKAEEVGAEVVLAVGRRLPRWPECHIPKWAQTLSVEDRNAAQLRYMEAVVNRYKDSTAVTVWQVENEPFLEVFAFDHCGKLDLALLDTEIALIRSLDGTRPILVTDSGNLGTWQGAYSRGDMFGTSVYVHFWNPELGQFRTFLPPWFYRVKDNFMALIYGEKPTMLIELSAEPWLLEPVVDVPLETQFTRMNLEKFEDIITYAEGTHFEKQYLWGAEWWYWLKLQGHPEMWERGKKLFVKEETE
jgi:hypothetical protein